MSYEKYRSTMNESQYADLLLGKLKEYPCISSVETVSFFSSVFVHRFETYLTSISPTTNTVFKAKADNYEGYYQKLLDVLFATDVSIVEAFARAKYYLDRIFYNMTSKGNLNYVYIPEVLLTAEELESELGVTEETVHYYSERGLEMTEGYGRKKYPLHNVFYWNKNLWMARLQVLNQAFQSRDRTHEEIKKEVEFTIQEFQFLYKTNFKEHDKTILDPSNLENPTGFYELRPLPQELKGLNKK